LTYINGFIQSTLMACGQFSFRCASDLKQAIAEQFFKLETLRCNARVTLCDSGGVMYWGDAYFHKVETASIDGTGRKTLLRNTDSQYLEFVYHAGNIYYTDRSTPAYARLLYL